MKNIRFELAGRIDNLDSTPFLTSRSREYKSGNTIFHRNDYHTTILIPEQTFKKLFQYERWSGVYRTTVTFRELLANGAHIFSEHIEQYGEKTKGDVMYMIIKSRRLNREFCFSVPGQSYIFVDIDGKPGSLGAQICEGGRISGNTLCYPGDDQAAFARICRNWYRAAMRRYILD